MQDDAAHYSTAIPPADGSGQFEEVSNLLDLGETFPYEVFLQDLPHPEELEAFLGPESMGPSRQTSPPNQATTQAVQNRHIFSGHDFQVEFTPPPAYPSPLLANQVSHKMSALHQANLLTQAPLLEQQQFTNQYLPPMSMVQPNIPSVYINPSSNQTKAAQLPQNPGFKQNGMLYPSVTPLNIAPTYARLPQTTDSSLIGTPVPGQPTQNAWLPLKTENANYRGTTYDPQPINSSRNALETSSTGVMASFKSVGSKRSSDEALQNHVKRQRTLGELAPFIDINDSGNEIMPDMNVGNKEFHGVILSTYEYEGYVYNYVMVEDAKKCSKCKKRFATSQQLTQHMKRVHIIENAVGSNKETESIVCTVCKRVFRNQTNLRRHIGSVHKDGEKHECPQCDAWFSTEHSLAKHKKEAHTIASEKKSETRPRKTVKSGVVEIGKDNLKVYVCGFCNDVRDTTANLKRHIDLTHLQKRDFVCEMCGRRFKTKSNMQSHQSSKRCVPSAEGKESEGDEG